ncbi:hypothetical protein GDO86_018667 [Hymenochirus boettgeri]|uniref:Olfactory receptor n=1 Tax=Hymenochirus boettgeri TaxID=247094 RepID=A0A8T2I8S3_9PIPI|nr:hypothetical protein GDO86_018667 [Hymenochirus boettgeri]
MNNQTLVSYVYLVGFQKLENLYIPLFFLFLLIYIVTVSENSLIIVLVSTSWNLESPMYFFLQQLSLCDLLMATNILPILLLIVIHDGVTISFTGCMIQFYIFNWLEAFECLLLSVMSFDRYLAICNPLRYTSIMNRTLCVELSLLSWVLSLVSALLTGTFIATLEFCGHIINHFFCDLFPLLELSCSDTFFVQIEIVLQSIPVVFFPIVFIILTYIYIVSSVLKIVSSRGRQKAFSTCSSHLAVVSLFYGALISIYLVPPSNQLLTFSKVLSLLYTVVIPMVNPLIYSLRNTDMKRAFRKLFRQKIYLFMNIKTGN